MTFTFENTPNGHKVLNGYLAQKSFISGYQPSQADVLVFDALGKKPQVKSFPHVVRWYNNIESYTSEERSAFGGQACPIKAGAKPTAAAEAPKPKAAPAAKPASKPAAKPADDDDLDLFGSDEEESAEAAAIREQRLKDYASKKSKKPTLIAKSSIVLDVKPWDDETDMKAMENLVRTIQMEGLVWGASKLVPVGYGIHKLQIMCVVEDDKVSVDLLTEMIQEFEDSVQSVDIAAFNKI